MGNISGKRRYSLSISNGIHIAVIGDSGVGKTGLCRTFITGDFEENTNGRVWYDYGQRMLAIRNKETLLHIWDISSTKRYPRLFEMYIRRAHGILLLYDVTGTRSFYSVRSWLNTVRATNPEAIVFLVGARSDLLDKNEGPRSLEAAKQFANSEKLELFECSARNGENIEAIFSYLALRIIEMAGMEPTDESKKESESKESSPLTLPRDFNPEGKFVPSLEEESSKRTLQNTLPVPSVKKEEGKSFHHKKDSLSVRNADSNFSLNEDQKLSHFNDKKCPSDLNEINQSTNSATSDSPDVKVLKKSWLEENEMLLEGKCPSW